jgi:hypothetical protein
LPPIDVDVITSCQALKALSHGCGRAVANKGHVMNSSKWGEAAVNRAGNWAAICRRWLVKIHKTLVRFREAVAAPDNDLPVKCFPETQALWFLLTGCREGTSKVFKDSVEKCSDPHPGATGTSQALFLRPRRRALIFRR